jgi:hypothetical protein
MTEKEPLFKQMVEADGVKAGYKLQFNFGPNRSGQKEFNAALTFWASGKFFHGGGDDQLYLCLNRLKLQEIKPGDSHKFYLDVIQKKIEGQGCGQLIPSNNIEGGVAYCANCKRMIVGENIVNIFYFRGMVTELSILAAEIFRRVLDSNADIYCKYDPSDIRYITMQRDKGSEEAHRLRGMLIYPLGRIIKDTSSGATLEGRFRALFTA